MPGLYAACTLDLLRDDDRPGEVWVYLGRMGTPPYHLIRRPDAAEFRVVTLDDIRLIGGTRDPNLFSNLWSSDEPSTPRTPERVAEEAPWS